jgi:hypothetical protein
MLARGNSKSMLVLFAPGSVLGPGGLDVDDSHGQYRIIEGEPGRLREELAVLRNVAAPVVDDAAGFVAEQVRVQVSHRHRA